MFRSSITWGVLTFLTSGLFLPRLVIAQGEAENLVAVRDPYSLDFDDFELAAPTRRLPPIAGSQEISEEVDWESAIRFLKARKNADPSNPMHHILLGEALTRQAIEEDDLPRFAEAEASLRLALKLSPANRRAQLALARNLLSQHHFTEAKELAVQLHAVAPQRPDVLSVLFDAHLELGDYPQAASLIQQLMELESSPPVLARAARVAELRGEDQQARQLLQRAVDDATALGSSSSTLAWYWWRIGNIAWEQNDLHAAESAFNRALALSPNDGASQVALAHVRFANGNLQGAIGLLQKAAESEAPPLLALLGDALSLAGRPEQAEHYWQRTERQMREEAKVAKTAHAREVAMFFADHNRNLEEARSLAALDFDGRHDAFAWDCRAWVAFKLGDFELARTASQHARAAISASPDMLFHAAMIEDALGNRESCAEILLQMDEAPQRFSFVYDSDLQELRHKILNRPQE